MGRVNCTSSCNTVTTAISYNIAEITVPLPKVIGCDFSGTVVDVSALEQQEEKKDEGEGQGDESSRRLQVGDKVIGNSYCQSNNKQLISKMTIICIPDDIHDFQIAGLMPSMCSPW